MKAYVYSIIVCAFGCRICSQLTANTKHKKWMHLVFGTLLAVTILRPLSRISMESLDEVLPIDPISAESYIAEGKKEALHARKECIEKACASYIIDKAQCSGSDLTVRFTLDENLIPICAEVEGTVEPGLQMQLQTILAADLGISKENQTWILYPENSSS